MISRRFFAPQPSQRHSSSPLCTKHVLKQNAKNILACFMMCALLTSCAAKTPTSTVTGTKPYTVKGKKYYPLQTAHGFVEEGEASWYGPGFHGNTTANGETYNQYALTAAHKLLPLGTTVHVTNLDNGKTVTLRVNDRGPFSGDRVLDVSKKAAEKLDMIQSGTAQVRIVSINTTAPQEAWTASPNTEASTQVLAPVVEEIMAQEPALQQGYTQAQEFYQQAQSTTQAFGSKHEENFSPHEYAQEYIATHSSPHVQNAYNNASQAKEYIQEYTNHSVSGTFYIQVGHFEVKKFASLLAMKLKDTGLEARSQKNDAGTWHVLVGPFTESHTARQKLSQFSQQFENVKLIEGEL